MSNSTIALLILIATLLAVIVVAVVAGAPGLTAMAAVLAAAGYLVRGEGFDESNLTQSDPEPERPSRSSKPRGTAMSSPEQDPP